jgi:HTH-type transcriptional regulator/antitoxin HigA
MDIKPLRTETDYRAALQEIEALMNAEPGTPEEDRLDVLATLVRAYEDAHYPIPKPSAIAALEYYLESRGLTRKALEPFIGPAHRVSEIMNRRRRLTLEMIRRLEQGIGIPATVLIQPYHLVDDPLRAQHKATNPKQTLGLP